MIRTVATTGASCKNATPPAAFPPHPVLPSPAALARRTLIYRFTFIAACLLLVVSFWKRNDLPAGTAIDPALADEPVQRPTTRGAFTTRWRDVEYRVEPSSSTTSRDWSSPGAGTTATAVCTGGRTIISTSPMSASCGATTPAANIWTRSKIIEPAPRFWRYAGYIGSAPPRTAGFLYRSACFPGNYRIRFNGIAGKDRALAYDAVGRLARDERGQGESFVFDWDGNGNLLSATDALGTVSYMTLRGVRPA